MFEMAFGSGGGREKLVVRGLLCMLAVALVVLTGTGGALAQPPRLEGLASRPETVDPLPRRDGALARPEMMDLPGLRLAAAAPVLHWTPPDPRHASGAKGATTRQGASLPEPNPALLLRSDLNRSVPLPDPGFEFKAGPTAVAKSPQPSPGQTSAPAGLGFRLLRLPVTFSAGSLDRDLGVGAAPPVQASSRARRPAGVIRAPSGRPSAR